MNLINLRDVPLDSLKQIYFKNNNVRKFQHIKPGHTMRVNQKDFNAFIKSLSLTSRTIAYYCAHNLKHHAEDIVKTMSIILDFSDSKDYTTANRNYFFKSIKELEDAGFLLKYKPKTYLVNPHYVSMLSSDQIRYLNDKRYQILGGEIDTEILKELK